MQNHNNHRKYPRVVCKTDLTIVLEEQVVGKVRCHNISLGGMCIETENYIGQGKKGRVWMNQHCDTEEISFSSEIVKVWDNDKFADTGNHFMGIMFTGIDIENWERLSSIVNWLIRKSGQ
jgi:hypothetical protein